MSGASNEAGSRLLQGARILVVEDEYMIADELCRTLQEAGAIVVGPVATMDGANAAIDGNAFDCAVLDLNLNGVSGLSLADRLLRAGKPFAIATGYGLESLPDHLRSVPMIEKPFDPSALSALVAQLNCATTA